MFLRCILLLVMLVTSVSAHAWRPPAKKEELVDRVLVLSGTKNSMRQASSQIVRGFHAAREMSEVNVTRREMTPEQRESLARIIRVMRTTFDHDVMIETVSAYLADNATEAQLEAAIKILQQKHVRRIVGMEIKAMNTVSPKVLNEFAHTLQIRKPSAKRMVIVDHIDRITEASKLSAALRIEITSAFFQSSPERMQRLSEGIHKQTKDQTLLTLLYAYRDLTERELEEYAQIYQDENYAWVARMIVRGSHMAVKQAFNGFKDSLVDWVLNEMETSRGPL